MKWAEFENEDGNKIAVDLDKISYIEEGGNGRVYIITTGNRGFGVIDTYPNVLKLLTPAKGKK